MRLRPRNRIHRVSTTNLEKNDETKKYNKMPVQYDKTGFVKPQGHGGLFGLVGNSSNNKSKRGGGSSSDTAFVSGKERNVYTGPRGGKYVKVGSRRVYV
jgi:hypothetical protein